MLLIPCPWCGSRDEVEFRYGGQAHVDYPASPDELSDEEWGAFLFLRDNPRGEAAERWHHVAGCRRWFNAVRDTTSNEVLATYLPGDPRPRRSAAAGVPGAQGTASRSEGALSAGRTGPAGGVDAPAGGADAPPVGR